MSNGNKSTLDLGALETLLVGVAEGLQKALAGVDRPGQLKRKDWPKVAHGDLSAVVQPFNEVMSEVEKAHREQTKTLRGQLMQALEARKARLEKAAKSAAPEVMPKRDGFVVSGRVFDEQTGVGLPNVVVRAFDMDRKYDDLLGETVTDENGYYAIEYTGEQFKDVLDATPETYIEVKDDAGNDLFRSTRSFVHKAGASEKIDAAIDGRKVESSLALARDRQIGRELVLNEVTLRQTEVSVRGSNLRRP